MTNEVPKSERDYLTEIESLHSRIRQLEAEKQWNQRLTLLNGTLSSNVLDRVLDYLPDFVYVKDLNYRFLFNNLAHARSIGIDNPADLVGKSDFDFFPQDLATQYFEDEQQVMTSGQPLLNREERSLGVDGQPIWALTSKVPLRDEQGAVIGLLGITRDISQRRAIQEKLVAREAEYRLVMNSMTDGLILRAADGKIITCNSSAERILALTESQLLGLTSIDPNWYIVREDGSPFLGESFPDMITLQTGEPQSNVIMGIHKLDDTWSWITVSSRPVVVADGEKPYGVVINFTDITALKTANYKLRESEERFRELADNIDITFLLYDYATRKPIYISPAYEKIWGRSSHVLFENPASHIDAIHPDHRSRVLQAITTSKASYEYQILKPDGGTRWIRTQSFPIRDANGQIVRTAEISEDVTERKLSEAEQQRAEALKNFLADASHDLHTPLAVANTSVYLLRRLIVANHSIDEQLKYVDMLGERIDHIREQLDDMFTLVRLDLENAFEFGLENINKVVEGVAAQYASLTATKQQRLNVELTADLPLANIDAKEIQHAIKCLLDNAIAYTPQQGLITIRTLRRNNQIAIEVEDTGIGIAEEHLTRIFNRFYRVDDARNTTLGRSGLGLTIAEKIIEAHHGRLQVTSETGKGSLFSILLPMPS